MLEDLPEVVVEAGQVMPHLKAPEVVDGVKVAREISAKIARKVAIEVGAPSAGKTVATLMTMTVP
jgi:hypothetical protein